MDDTSAYLSLPLRSLRELFDETEMRVAELKGRRDLLTEKEIIADTELRFDAAAALSAQADAITDEIDQLEDRLDVLEEEIAWRDRNEERRDSPIVL